MTVKPPFSRREIGSQAWIQDDLPETSRIAILHLLHDLVDRQYVGGWIDIDKEVRRIAREEPINYERKVESLQNACISIETILKSLPWTKVFDFCERLYSHLAIEVHRYDNFGNDCEVQTSREEVQIYIADELQRIFLEENLAYAFVQGEVRRRGKSHTRQQISKAEPMLGDLRLTDAREHYAKALRYFEHPSKPDFENVVKEAVCAVEAAARHLFPQTHAKTLGDVIKQIKGSREGQIPKPLADTIIGLYAYRSAGEGVSHGAADGGKATQAIAEYALAITASQIILLHEIASEAEIAVPF